MAVTIAVVALVLAAVAVVQTRAGRPLAATVGLAAATESFTELAFDHPADLGTTKHFGPVQLPISFRIANHQHQPELYRWRIALNATDVAEGAVELKPGAAAEVDRQVLVRCPPLPPKPKKHANGRLGSKHAYGRSGSRPYVIGVSLAGRSESIDFLGYCRA